MPNAKEMAIERDKKVDELNRKLDLIMKALKIKEPKSEGKDSKKA